MRLIAQRFVRQALSLVAIPGVIAISLVLAAPSYAQDSGASLRGEIGGQAGSGMRVVASNTDSGFRREVAVREDGSYFFPSLRTGRYRIELLDSSGASLGSREVTLRVGQDAVLPLASSVGQMEEVVVFGQQIKTMQGSEIGLNITPEQIDSLPQNSRNFLAFADLAPGVSFQRGSNGATRIQGGAQDSRSINVFIDGVGQKDYVLKNGITGQDSSQGNPFPQSAIGEYQVITQNYKAEFDQVSSAAIVAVTKSGSNEFEGDVFYDFTDEGLRAKLPREIELDNPKVETTDEQFGVSFGGPIMRDRLHFFVAYEGKRNEFPIDVAPGAGVDPATLPAQYQALLGVFNRDFEEDLFFGKLDYLPTDRDLFQFSVKLRDESGLRWDGGVNTREFTHPIINDETRVLFRYEHTSDVWINDARLTYEESAWNPKPDRANASFLELSGNQRILNVGGHPNFQDKGQQGIGLQNDFTWIAFDDHDVKMGVKLKWVELDTQQQQPFNPQYRYNTEFDPDGMTTFNDSVPYRVSIGSAIPGVGDGSAVSDNFQFGIYIQDDWQATDRLEVSYGIRWDYEDTPIYKDYVTPADVVTALTTWPNLDNANYDVNDYISTGGNRDNFDGAFAPRLGFSYDLTDTYTLFGGYGRSYDRNQFDFIRGESSAQTFRTFQFDFDTGDPDHPCAGCPAWDPVYLTEAGRATLLSGAVSGGGREIRMLPNELDLPYSDQFSLGLRGVWDSWDGEVGFSHVAARDGFAWLLGNRLPDGSFFPPGAIWGPPFGARPPGFGNVLLGVSGLESDANSAYLKVAKPFDEDSGWGFNATYTFTDAEENRVFGQTFSLNYETLDGYPVLTSAGVTKHRLVASGSINLPWDVRLSGKYTYRSPIYRFGIGSPGDANDQRIPRVAEADDDFQQLDLALVKYFSLGSLGGFDGSRFRVRFDVLNVFNNTNLTNFIGNGTNVDFATAANRDIGGNLPRTVKFSIGYSF